MNKRAKAVEYELLAKRLADRLSAALGAATELCKHNVRLKGRGTTNQIDVLWIGQINGERHRILIECKNHTKPLAQGLAHAFRSVVDDLAADGIPTTGVFVHPVGYQKGAKKLAKTYDLVLLELREPAEEDLAGIVLQINLDIVMTELVFRDVSFDWVAEPADLDVPSLFWDIAMVELPNDREPIGAQLLLANELGRTTDEQVEAGHRGPKCRVEFPAPADIRIDGQLAGAATAVSGTAHVAERRASSTIGPGRSGIAHIAKDVLGAETVWFMHDGEVRVIKNS